MFTFDTHGHLTPDQPIEATLEEIQATFVFNEHRRSIFIKLIELWNELRRLKPGTFMVWIDGSFATMKENPRDVDCVFFVNFKWLGEHEKIIETIQNTYSELVDVYFVSIYPEGHRYRIRTESDRIKWLHFFTTDRRKIVKGLIQINFDEDGNL